MGTQKNRLNETVLFHTQNTCLNWWVRKYSQFYAKFFRLTGPMYFNKHFVNQKKWIPYFKRGTIRFKCTPHTLIWNMIDQDHISVGQHMIFWHLPPNLSLFVSSRPINIFSVMQGQVFLRWTSTKLGLMCLAQGHNTVTPVRLEPTALRSWVKHSTTEPPPNLRVNLNMQGS